MSLTERNPRDSSQSKVLFALCVFVSAFLLFQVQPLIGKFILPWFGGAPSVWTTCMLFFQLMLLAGYCYAHLIVKFLTRRQQGVLHVVLLLVTLALLPIIPREAWKPTSTDDPTFRILGLLTLSVGGPYFMLAATAPLLQSWFFHAHKGASPFRLYSLSNAGSLLALFSFPFVVERVMRSTTQAWVWSATYILFAVLCFGCALGLKTANAFGSVGHQSGDSTPLSGDDDQQSGNSGITIARLILWLALAACGSLMLLAATNELCQDVAAVPFLWVLPLTIYLLSFVICFDNERWYHREWYGGLLILSVLLISAASISKAHFMPVPLVLQVAIHSLVLFACCMTCHGELVKLKPAPRHLTTFYLMVSLGGAMGGVFVALIAPVVFDQFLEYGGGIVATCILAVVVRRYEQYQAIPATTWRGIAVPAGIVTALAIVLAVVLRLFVFTPDEGVLESERNFYGTLQITRDGTFDPLRSKRWIIHGTTRHGFQYEDDSKRELPTLYYRPDTGVGFALENHPRRRQGDELRVGVVGLGCGTLSTYMGQGDYLGFYEINPAVVSAARKYFTYMEDASDRGAEVELFVGDARRLLELQLDSQRSQQFDILVIDAFSSDSVPVHLLTAECFDLYWKHLRSDGVLAVHISNRYLDLSPVVRTLAARAEKSALLFKTTGGRVEGELDPLTASTWVVVTDNRGLITASKQAPALAPWSDDPLQPILWTDNFSNLFSVLQ